MRDRIFLVKQDITCLTVDAIVNAANSSLMGGGGVDGAIHRAGGPAILEECKTIVLKQGRCKPGQAVITTAGNLPAKHVIHTVGPIWNQGKNNEAARLSDCYRNSLSLAKSHAVKTIAFPNISTGIYGYPKKEAAIIAINSVQSFIASDAGIEKIYFACFDEENFLIYQQLLHDSLFSRS